MQYVTVTDGVIEKEIPASSLHKFRVNGWVAVQYKDEAPLNVLQKSMLTDRQKARKMTRVNSDTRIPNIGKSK